MWTLKEMQKYQERDYQPLSSLYERAGLRFALPHKRAEYLAVKVFNLDKQNYDSLMRQAGKKSRIAMLHYLEDLAIEKLKEVSK